MRYAAETEKLFRDAAGFARGYGHSYVGTEHLLLAMVNCGGCAQQILQASGLCGELAHGAVLMLRGNGVSGLPLRQGWSPSARSVM